MRAQLLDRLISQTGEVLIARSRVDARLSQARSALNDLTGNLERLRTQLRDIEVQAESQMQSRLALSKDTAAGFDPLEFDRFTRVQELTRMMAESVNDVATVQRNLQRDLAAAEDDLVAQGRQARDLQRDLLRTRMVEFDSFAERLYAVVRQTSKEMGKQVRLNILGGTIEMDRGMLERMMPAFEHLLRNCVAHGIESPERRQELGKPAVGTIEIVLGQERNDVALSVEDDGAGLDLERIRAKAISLKLWTDERPMTLEDAGRLIFEPGFTTATEVTGVAGRGIGMDVVRSEVNALGGRIETHTEPGRGSAFRLVVPLTTAVTQVVMLRMGAVSMGVPANLVEIVRRVPVDVLEESYRKQEFQDGSEVMPFYWAGALWHTSLRSEDLPACPCCPRGPWCRSTTRWRWPTSMASRCEPCWPGPSRPQPMANCRLSQAVPICWAPKLRRPRCRWCWWWMTPSPCAASPSVCCSAKATVSRWPLTACKPWSVCRTSARPWCCRTSKCRAWTASTCCAISAPIRRSKACRWS